MYTRRCASPAVYTRRCALAAQLRKLHLGIGQIFSRDMTVQCDAQHPCWKAAHFLPCTRPPDVMRLHRSSNRATYGPLNAARSWPRGLDFQRCRLEGTKMLRPQLPSLAQLRDPFVVLRLLHRRTTCGHRRFELLASCVHAARPLRSWVHRASHVSGGHFLYLLLL